MRKPFLCLVAALASCALAEHDFGLQQEVDEFTRETSCSHLVINSTYDRSGISLFAGSEYSEPVIAFTRHLDSIADSVFNMFIVMPDDRVFVRFPSTDEVFQFTPVSTGVEDTYEVALIQDQDLIFAVLSSPTEIRVRFDGSNGTADFTIDHDVILALAAGFGKTCLR